MRIRQECFLLGVRCRSGAYHTQVQNAVGDMAGTSSYPYTDSVIQNDAGFKQTSAFAPYAAVQRTPNKREEQQLEPGFASARRVDSQNWREAP